MWKFFIIFERGDFKKILFEIFWPLKESKSGEESNDNTESVETEANNTLMPPKENEDRYTSTPERTRIDAKGYPFLETSYPPSRFKPYFVQKMKNKNSFLSAMYLQSHF